MPAVPDGAFDPAELLEQLRTDRARARSWGPIPPSATALSWPDNPLARSDAFAYVNGHWALPTPDAGAGRGLRARVRGVIARALTAVLRPYLESERELLAHLVQLGNVLVQRCDEMAAVIAERERARAEADARLLEFLEAGEGRGSGTAAP